MTDIVQHLLRYYETGNDLSRTHAREAADEIERLNRDVINLEGYLATQRDEIERLREREAELQAQWGFAESISALEIERLRGELKQYRERLGLR